MTTVPAEPPRTPAPTPVQTEAEPPAEAPVAEVQPSLPFDEGSDEPIAFALTARARRVVAPHALPALRVVPQVPTSTGGLEAPGDPTRDATDAGTSADPAPEDEASDTRPARARALRRAGARPTAIASQLGVDPVVVRAWTDGVRGVAHVTALPVPTAADDAEAEDAARRAAFASERTTARARGRAHLAARPDLSGGLGVLAACTEAAPDGVTVTTTDPRVAAAALRWVAEVLGTPTDRWRTVLRLGERAAADLAVHRWATSLGVPRERVRTTRWAGTADPHAEEVRCRLPDPVVAATVAGWCDALLDGPEDVAF